MSAATLVIVLGVLTPAFGFFVTATVLPSVIADVGGLAFYAWASTAYSVASILGSATSAVIVRKTATRTALLVASAIFVAGTIACALAPSMLVLVAGRALQGFGGGMMIAAVHGVVRDVFPEALWPRMLAMISVAWGVAAMSGPAIGGTFASLGVWRGAFWIIVPLTVVAAALTWRIVPHAPAHAKGSASRVPLGRLALLCVGVLCVASVANVASTIVRVALVLAALGAIALVLRLDARARERLFPADMLSLSRPMGKAFGMIFFLAMCTTPGSVYIPLLLQILQGFAPATAGYFYAAQSLAWTFAALVVTRLAGHQLRVALVVGPLMIAIGFAGLLATISTGPAIAIAVAIVVVGAGVGTCWAPVGTIVLGAARHGEGPAAASMIPTTQTFAVALGAALCGIVGNAAGLSSAASRPVAALAGGWLFTIFLMAPLGALAMASGLRAPGRDDRPAAA